MGTTTPHLLCFARIIASADGLRQESSRTALYKTLHRKRSECVLVFVSLSQRCRLAPGNPIAASNPTEMSSSTTSEATQAVRTENVCRYYPMGGGLIHAVDGISLTVERGEFVALLGQSGSGKSTLLNLLAGLDRPTSGSVLVQGRDLARMSSEELARYHRNGVGMVFQAFHLIPSMTITENVELPMRFAEVEGAERAQRVRESLERVG